VPRGRAKKGGETAHSNKYFYKGGRFLPSTEAPPGTYKVNGKVLGTGKEQTEPGKWETQPHPLARSIHGVIGAFTHFNNGKMELRHGIRTHTGEDITHETTFRPGVKGILSTKEHPIGDLINHYNSGKRWIDVELPEGAHVLKPKESHVLKVLSLVG
jgi:hypothetical protein